MNALYRIRRWVLDFQTKWGELPKTIPMTPTEVREIEETWASCRQTIQLPPEPPKLFDIETEQTVFAESIRERRLTVPVQQFVTEAPLESLLTYWRDIDWTRQMWRQVLVDKTEITVCFEWDLLARFKRLLRITRWFPVKHREAKLDCTVLYPYCKVQLPHNRHAFQVSMPTPL